jgi:succinoglycan biosynthesis transport protein ExoP
MNIRNTINSLKSNGDQPQLNPNTVPYLREEEEEEISLSIPKIKFWLRRRGWLMGSVFLVVSISSIVYAFTKPPVYEESFTLLIETPTQTPTGISAIDSSLLNLGGLARPDESYVLTQVQVLSGYNLISPVLKKIEEVYPSETEDDVIEYEAFIQNKLRINNPKDTNLIKVTYKDENPEKVNFVLTELSKNYVNYSLNEPRLKKGQGLEFVQKQLPELERKVSDLQRELEKFRQRHNIVDPESQRQIITNNLPN